MKILLTVFEINDYGGIISHVENMGRGFREMGHECSLVILRDSKVPMTTRRRQKPNVADYPSVFNGTVHTTGGWFGVPVIGYGSMEGLMAYARIAKEYDIIFHEVPCPADKGMWREIYKTSPRQVICAHDAHYQRAYRHLDSVAHLVKGISTTNAAGYVGLAEFKAPRAFIGAPHILEDWTAETPWEHRQLRTICAHVWKPWKQMHKAVEAATMLKESYMFLGGDGIEGRYMRSKEKCKPKYEGLWNKFLGSTRCNYLGMLTHSELFTAYKDARVMLDLSYSAKFAELGNHFNRSCIESYNCGVVPICTLENMEEKNVPVPLFQPWENYVAISKDASPEEIADFVDTTVHMHPDDAERMILNGRTVLRSHFDYHHCCKQHINLAFGRKAGVYSSHE